MNFETLVGAGILAFLSAYLFLGFKRGVDSRTEAKQAHDPFTIGFMLLMFASLLFSLFLIGKVSLEENDYCDIVQNASIVINESNHTSPPEVWHAHEIMYTYERVCFPNTSQSSLGLFKLTNLWIIASSIFLLIIMIWAVYQYLKMVLDEYKRG